MTPPDKPDQADEKLARGWLFKPKEMAVRLGWLLVGFSIPFIAILVGSLFL